jgi:hypothetical protein
MKRPQTEIRPMVRIGAVDAGTRFASYVYNGRTGEARKEIMASLTEAQRAWLKVRPWEARVVSGNGTNAVIYARMGKYGNFEREELIARILFNG